MPSTEDAERRLARGLAVDEAYHALERYQVDRRRLVFIANDERRAGGYGVVRQAHLHPSSYLPTWLASSRYGPPQVVAVKEIKLSALHNVSNLKRAFTKEVLVWSGLGEHPGIAKFLGFCADFERSEAWLISPWEPYGNVSEFIHARKLKGPEKLSLVYDTIDALTFLHQLNPPVCHGDIKSANVLVNAECRAVFCDFGLARLYEDSGFGRLETSTGFKGSIRWCSPELLNGQPRSASSDVYAWAWLVWEIMTGQLPYGDASADYVIMRRIFEGPGFLVQEDPRLRDGFQVWELMNRCWAVEPEQRPTSAMCKTTIEHLPHYPHVLETADSPTRSAARLENLAALAEVQGDNKEVSAYLEQALHLYEEEGNDRGIANVLRKQATVARLDCDFVKSMVSASAALERFKGLNDEIGIAESLHLIGDSLLASGQAETALARFRESLEIFRAKENSVGIVRCLERLGEVYRRNDQYTEAFSVLEEAADIASACGYRLGEGIALVALGATHVEKGDLDEGFHTFQKARDIARSIGWESGVSTILCRLGDIERLRGNLSEAEELLCAAVTTARRWDPGWRLAQALHRLGVCYKLQGRIPDAGPALEESYHMYQVLGITPDPGFALDVTGLADALPIRPSSIDLALNWYERAIAVSFKYQDLQSVSTFLRKRGSILVFLGRYDEGALHFEASMAIGLELGDDHGVGLNRNKLSSIPKTPIKWEVRRQARLALSKIQMARTPSLLCDVKKLQRRVPQLTTPHLKSSITVFNKSDS